MLVGLFRRNDSDDAETFVAAVTRIFMAYPPKVVSAAVDPAFGIASKQTFLPSQAELVAELELRMMPLRAELRRQAEHEHFLAVTGPSASATPEQRERAVEAWERTKAEITGEVRRDAEDERQAAERRISELYRESRNPKPLVIGDELRAKLERMRAGA